MQYLHDDAVAMTLLVANYTTKWVSLDSESSMDILFKNAFSKIGIDHNRLYPFLTSLKGLFREEILSVGAATLPMTIRKAPFTSTNMMNVLVVKALLSCNIILGCLTLNNL